jgi:hypothetical protein
MALIDKAKQYQEEQDEGPEHEAMPGDAAEDAAEGEAPESGAATPELIDKMQQALIAKVPPDKKEAFTRIFMAGQKVMYSEGSSELVRKEMERKAPIDAKLAHAAAGLMLILHKESKGQMPPDVGVLAGAALLLEMADFALKTGQQMTQQDVRDALDQYVALVMMKYGAKPDQIMGAIQGQAPQQPAPQGPPQAAPGGGAPMPPQMMGA